MITYGKPEYIGALKTLWHETFGDSMVYIDSFFDCVYKDENTLVCIKNNHPVSALYMVPYKMIQKTDKIKTLYLYALATAPEYRGQGIMSRLIELSLKIGIERGYMLCALIPSEDSLFGYYRKFGFESSFGRVKIIKRIMEIREASSGQKALSLKTADCEQIWNAYVCSRFYEQECIVLSKEQNRFYIKELEREGGQALIFDMEAENDGYLLLKSDGGELAVYETNATPDVLSALYAALLKEYDFNMVTFYQPLCFTDEESSEFKKPYAMSKDLGGIKLINPFINRVLT